MRSELALVVEVLVVEITGHFGRKKVIFNGVFRLLDNGEEEQREKS
jgi:hypothetical protein